MRPNVLDLPDKFYWRVYRLVHTTPTTIAVWCNIVHKHQVTYFITAKVMSLERWLPPNIPTSHNSSGVSAVWWKEKKGRSPPVFSCGFGGHYCAHLWMLSCFFLWFDEELILQSVQKIDHKSARVLKYPEEREGVSLLSAVSISFYTRFTFLMKSGVCLCKSHHHNATVFLVVVTVMLCSSSEWVLVHLLCSLRFLCA